MIVPGLLNGASEADANPTAMSVIPVDRGHTMTVPKSNRAQIKAASGKRWPPHPTLPRRKTGGITAVEQPPPADCLYRFKQGLHHWFDVVKYNRRLE